MKSNEQEKMKPRKWTQSELLLLKIYWSINVGGTEDIPEDIVEDADLILSKLIITNKDVIAYENGIPIGKIAFSVLLSIMEEYKERPEEITYHPVNFHSIVEFNEYLKSIY